MGGEASGGGSSEIGEQLRSHSMSRDVKYVSHERN